MKDAEHHDEVETGLVAKRVEPVGHEIRFDDESAIGDDLLRDSREYIGTIDAEVAIDRDAVCVEEAQEAAVAAADVEHAWRSTRRERRDLGKETIPSSPRPLSRRVETKGGVAVEPAIQRVERADGFGIEHRGIVTPRTVILGSMDRTDANLVRQRDARLSAAIARVARTLGDSRDGKAWIEAIESHLGGTLAKHEIRRVLGEFAPEDAARLRAKPVRSLSGIAPLSLLTKPFPCPGKCVFCPNDVRMPKSYLSMEPGAQRATRNKFDPYAQTWNRLLAFSRNGHPIDKIELIVMGGTFTAYPRSYQRWFITRTFEALCDFDSARGPVDPPATARDFLDCDDAAVTSARGGYDAAVRDHLRAHHVGSLLAEDETASDDDVRIAHRRNELAAVRCVGLSIETRPDAIDQQEIAQLRRLGVTKVQLGYQSNDDAILAANRRGATVDDSRRATRLLRLAGFKVQAHWMPNLLGATPESDARDFERLFADPDLRPDELKIYPNALIASAETMNHFESGAWRPYSEEELVDLLATSLARTPRYCRVSRVIRDIPSHDIVEGNKKSNLREVASRHARRRGLAIVDIRARQIARALATDETPAFRENEYALHAGREVFLDAATDRDELLGFLRLHLPHDPRRPVWTTDLAGAAIVRELHVYGAVSPLGARIEGHTQHRGLGGELLRRAEAIARSRGFARMAVISAVGTRDYYRHAGYRDGESYSVKDLDAESAS